ncbi:hypothetical protein [Dyella sp.]|uniref:hypothetical protein n=1 Tax=Dyella sp. TaxID=1869338 RepID=UPI002ED35D45
MKFFSHGAKPFRSGVTALLLALAVLVSHGALAQGAANSLPAADQQAIKSYNLNEDVFNRLLAATKDARAQGIHPQQAPSPGSVHNLDDLANAALKADPRIGPLIKKYGFTPRDFMLANLALMNAAIASNAKTDPETAKYVDQTKVNQANVAFYESHQAQLNALMAAPAGGAGAQPAPQGK